MAEPFARIHPILVRTEISANVGAAVRAAAAGGLAPVRLAAPACEIDGEARALAAGAADRLASVRLFPSLDEALEGMDRVYAFTARRRDLRAPPRPLPLAAPEVLKSAGDGEVALLFGPERTGLTNEEVDRAQVLVTIPTAPDFRSINLAQSVMVAAYALRAAHPSRAPRVPRKGERSLPAASAEELEGLLDALEEALGRRDFFEPNKRPLAMRRVRDLLFRAAPRASEVQLLRGMLRALSG